MPLQELRNQANLRGIKNWVKHKRAELLRRVNNIKLRRRFWRPVTIDDDDLLYSSCGDLTGSEEEDAQEEDEPTQPAHRRVTFRSETSPPAPKPKRRRKA